MTFYRLMLQLCLYNLTLIRIVLRISEPTMSLDLFLMTTRILVSALLLLQNLDRTCQPPSPHKGQTEQPSRSGTIG